MRVRKKKTKLYRERRMKKRLTMLSKKRRNWIDGKICVYCIRRDKIAKLRGCGGVAAKCVIEGLKIGRVLGS